MSRRRFASLYALAWLPFLATYALIIGLRSASVQAGVFGSASNVGSAALLGLGVWWCTGRLPWSTMKPAAFVASHAFLALLYSAAWTGSIVFTLYTFADRASFEQFVGQALFWNLVTGVVFYASIAAIAYAVRGATRAREQEARAARAEAMHVEAELRALRAQLNPHFLFNTLHSITALVRSDPKEVEDALERLAGLLRYVLDVHGVRGEEVSLEEELGFVRAYLSLEQLRLGARLRVVEEIDADALDCTVLAFTLQPLVENAIRHGIAPRPAGGMLRLSAQFAGERLMLEVADDGNGTERARVDDAAGLGLRAVRDRLRTRHAGDAQLELVTAPGQGFLARLTLPIAAARRAAVVAR